VWAVQKRLHVRQAVKGFGKLLEEMPQIPKMGDVLL
jgi:hypothetical protein